MKFSSEHRSDRPTEGEILKDAAGLFFLLVLVGAAFMGAHVVGGE